MSIPDKLKERINDVADYIGQETNDWLLIKRHLIISFPNEGRRLFSVRHPCTKKQILNAFDKLVMAYWKELTGIEPIIDPSKIHPDNWTHKKKGWALTRGQKNE
jgi:hypothetical protein